MMQNPVVVATLCLDSTEQTLELRADQTLIVGRGTFKSITSNHISRKQVLIVSKGKDVIITRLGTNRSFLDGKELPKDEPVVLAGQQVLTLLELQHPVTIKLTLSESLEEDIVNESRAEGSRAQTSAMLFAQATPVAPVLAAEASKLKPTLVPLAPARIRQDVRNRYSDGSMSEGTSDSERDEHPVEKHQVDSDVSVESDIICEELSDLDTDRHAQEDDKLVIKMDYS